jgi:hypothetical protein
MGNICCKKPKKPCKQCIQLEDECHALTEVIVELSSTKSEHSNSITEEELDEILATDLIINV